MFKGLDHIAIVVRDTDEALKFYRDTLGLPLVLSEVLEEQAVRLTHLDFGNTHLQLVEPLSDASPLAAFLDEHGEGLHHLCLSVDSVPQVIDAPPTTGIRTRDKTPRRGPRGRQAAFIDPSATRGVLFEVTDKGLGD